MPDNIIFGRPVFTREQAEKLMSALRQLLDQAEEKAFVPGIAAIAALQATATLVLLAHEATLPSTRKAHERELSRMGVHMEYPLELHHAAGQ